MAGGGKADKENGIYSRYYRCDCYDGHYVHFGIFGPDVPDGKSDTYVSIESAHYPSGVSGIWERMKGAWKILRGKEFCVTEVLLTEDDVKDLQKFIDDTLMSIDNSRHVESTAKVDAVNQ